jgi:hypothetical protein
MKQLSPPTQAIHQRRGEDELLGAPGGQAAPQGAGPHLSAGSHPWIQALAGAATLHLPLLSVAAVVAAILPVLQSPCLTHHERHLSTEGTYRRPRGR